MRICHVSDIHWRGFQRHKEYVDVFEKAFEAMEALQPDIIVNTGDTFHTKTQNITPEVIERLTWMIRRMTQIAPTYTLLGNHDGNLANASRQDVITPIHQAMNNPRHHLLKDSKEVVLTDNITLYPFSPFDRPGWSSLNPDPKKISIALFHGTIAGARTEGGFSFSHGEKEIKDFKDFDFLLLGDVHYSQHCGYRKDTRGNRKPWAAYAGSLVQQNFGEGEEKGFLVWDIESRNQWNLQFVPIENPIPFVNCDWKGDIRSTLEYMKVKRKERAFIKGARYRFSHTEKIPPGQVRVLSNELSKHGITSVAFNLTGNKQDISKIDTETASIKKSDLRSDPTALHKLFLEFVDLNNEKYQLTEEQKTTSALEIIKEYLFQLQQKEEKTARDICWNLKSLKWDNLYCYGEGNSLDFEKMRGLVGIFGPNKMGKSSIAGALTYGLFNTTDRGPIKNARIIQKGVNEGGASIVFSVDGNEYLVERRSERQLPKRKNSEELTRKDLDKAATSLEIWPLIIDPKTGLKKKGKPLTDLARDDTDKVLREIIGTSDDFLLTSFANQGNIDSFVRQGPTDRKKILTRFLGLDVFEKLYLMAKSDLGNLLDRCKNTDLSETVIDEMKETLRAVVEKISQTQEIIDWKQTQLDSLNRALLSRRDGELPSLSELEEKRRNLDYLRKQINQHMSDVGSLKEKLAGKEEEMSSQELLVKTFDIKDLEERLKSVLEKQDEMSSRQTRLKTEELVLENQNKSVQKLATVPCGDSFPDCRFIRDSHKDKALMLQQAEQVYALKDEIKDIQKELSLWNIQSLQKDKQLFEQTTKKLESLRTDRFHVKTEIERHEMQISHKEEKVLQLQKEIEKMDLQLRGSNVEEVEAMKAEIEKVKAEIRNFSTNKESLLSDKGAMEAKIEIATEKLSQFQANIEATKVQQAITDAMGKTGIPALVLKTQLPAINAELETLLSSIHDFNVTLDVDLSSNAMDIFIEDSNSTREIELGSGAEKMVASLALRIALLNLSSLPKSDIFVIDEGFGALDESNLQMVMDFLRDLKNVFKTILIVTHVAPLKDIVDSIVEITKENGTSKVVVS